MDTRLESALFDVLARLDAGERLSPDALRSAYPDCWQDLRDVLELRERFVSGAGAGADGPAAGSGSRPGARLRCVDAERYAGFRVLGQGGMGTVYWALDTDLNREVAFKVVRPDPGAVPRTAPSAPLDLVPPSRGTPASQAFETIKARFLQEAWVTAGLEHPGIVPLYEVGETREGVPYYTMRFLRGGRTLAAAISDVANRPIDERLALLDPYLRICDTIRYAHSHGVIHRDLKPHNIALGEFGEVVVLDWGIAKMSGRPDTAAATWQARLRECRETVGAATRVGALGTPGYMSPEAAVGRVGDVDERSDVYSLGCILFEILTGRLPYEFRTYSELLHRIYEGAPPAPAALDGSVPEELSSICARCLLREREARPSSVDALAAEIRAWLARRAGDREVEALRRVAAGAMSATEGLKGDALLRQLDRAHAAAAKVLERCADDAVAGELVAAVHRLRESGIRQREHGVRRRAFRRAAVVGLALALLGAAGAGAALHSEQTKTLEALGNARSESRAKDAAARRMRALGLAGASAAAEPSAPMRALLLAREAARVELLPAVAAQLHSAIAHSPMAARFRGHAGMVNGAAISPSGDRVVTGSSDWTARVWDLQGRTLAVLRGHEGGLTGCSFSPRGDEVLTWSADGTARLWRAADGSPGPVLGGFADAVLWAAHSPTGDRVAAGSKDGTVRIWAPDGRLVAERVGSHGGWARCGAWSPSGDRMVTGAGDGLVRILDRDGTTVRTLAGHTGPVVSVCFSPVGDRVLSGSRDGTLRLWTLDDAAPVVVQVGEGPVQLVSFSPSGDAVAAACVRTVTIWSVRGELLATLNGHGNGVTALSFSPDGDTVLTAGDWDLTARLWDRHGATRAVLHGHAAAMHGAAFSADGGRVLTWSSDATACLWRTHGEELASFVGHKDIVSAVAVNHAGTKVVTASWDRTARLWTTQGKPLAVLSGHSDNVDGASFSPADDLILTVSRDGTARLWSADDGTPLGVVVGPPQSVQFACFSPSGDRILTVSQHDRTAHLRELDGTVIQSFKGHAERFSSCCYSPGGDFVATSSWDGTARLWNLDGSQRAVLEGHVGIVECVAVSPGADVIATSGWDDTVRLWNSDGSERWVVRVPIRPGPVTFSPDGEHVAAGLFDGSVRVWGLDGREVAAFAGTSGHVTHLTFTPDGRGLLSSSTVGAPQLWLTRAEELVAFADSRILRSFTRAERESYAELLGPRNAAALTLRDRVDSLYEVLGLGEEVLDALRADPGLTESDRREALGIASERMDDRHALIRRAWELVRPAGRDAELYRRAMRWAEWAVILGKEDWRAINCLGAAQCRAGEFRRAAATLDWADGAAASARAVLEPADEAFRAVAHARSGSLSAARGHLGRLHAAVGDGVGSRPDVSDLVREADAAVAQAAREADDR